MLAPAGLRRCCVFRYTLRLCVRSVVCDNDSKFLPLGRELKNGGKGSSILNLQDFCDCPGLAQGGCLKPVTPRGKRSKRKLPRRPSCRGIVMAVGRLEMDFRIVDGIPRSVAQDTAPGRCSRAVDRENQKSREEKNETASNGRRPGEHCERLYPLSCFDEGSAAR